jgi:Skp family chaperone for outer membrane proteins
MKSFVVAASLALVVGLSPVFAQAPAKPAAPPAKPAAPATPPAEQPAKPEPVPQQQPPAPFPQGAKIAYVNLQAIAQLSADGKAAAAKVQALTAAKTKEIAEKTKGLQALRQKLETGGNVMSDTARAQLEKDIEKLTREAERFQQDAQVEVNELQTSLQNAFQAKLLPVLDEISKEKELHFLFSGADAGLIWVAPGLDLTLEAVKRFDAVTAPKQ